MKKLISYLVIMTMFLNLFVFALPVTADTTFDGTVYELDFTKLTSLEGTNVAVTSDDYVKVSLTSEGLKMEQIASKLLNDSEARNTANAGAIKGGFVVTLDKDDANRTVTVADKLKGKFDLIFDYAANVDRYSTHPDDTNIKIEGYYVFNVGNSSSPKQFNSMKENVLITRVDQKNYTTLNSASQTTSTMSKVNLTANNLGGAEHSVKVSYDTESKTQTVMLDNDETLVSTGPMGGTQGYVNAFVMMGLQRMNVGAYLTLKKVQVANYTHDSATQTILNALPAKLADDVNAVKENITIPVIDGVTWKTSDASVISETGVVTRGEADKTVTITATCDGITKTYKMTVAKEEVVVPDEPDEPVIPDEPDEPSNDSVNYEVDFTKLTSLENVNWKVEGSDYINAHLTGDFDLVKEDIPFISGFGSSGIFNAMLFKCQEAYNEGSYIEIKDLKLYEVLPDVYDTRYINALTAMAKMPEKLVENPLNVTSDITNIPTEVDGIKLNWSTGNVMVLTKEGKVTNWVDTSDTYLGASVSFADPDDTTKSPLVYTKKYKVTIPAMEGAESKLVYTGTFDNNWKFGYIYSTKTADHEFTENSLKFEQITTDDPTAYTNKKNHYGILRFNGVEIPYDEETRAEVYSDTFSGIYDFEFDLQANIASEERPVSVDLGFYDTVNDVFKILGSVETYTNKTQLRVWTSSSRSEAYEFTGSLVNKTNIRLRVDTTINKMWVFIGETLVTEPEGISYYNPVGEKGIINAMRIAMDENLELGDTAEISNIKLTQKLLNEVAEKADLIKAAEGITVNMITNTPSAVTGSIKTLPSKVGAYDVKWSSLSPDIINVETGSVYGTETENEVFVVAEIYDASANNPVNVKKSFKLTVPEASASGVIAYRLNLFELSDYVKQPLNSISYDLDLPSADAFGSSVSWKSSNTAVIDNDGNLAENVTKATKVTLTATLSANGARGTKTFEITVMPKTAENVVYSGTGESFTVGGVENASVYGNVSVTVTKDTEDTVAVYNKDGDKVAEVNFADYGKTTLSIVFMPDEGVYNVLDAEGNILDECL